MTRKALIVITSHDKLGETVNPTGFYWEEMATPYWQMRDAGFEVHLASVAGGTPPADPGSDDGEGKRPVDVQRFMDDDTAMAALTGTTPVADVNAQGFDVLYLPGGHGTMWDLPGNDDLARAVRDVYEGGGVVAAVCHGPAGLLDATLSDGTPLVSKRRVNGFTNAEEQAAGLAEVVPFLLEDALKAKGGRFEGNDTPFGVYAVRDGRLVTGQNPASSEKVGRLIIEALDEASGTRAA